MLDHGGLAYSVRRTGRSVQRAGAPPFDSAAALVSTLQRRWDRVVRIAAQHAVAKLAVHQIVELVVASLEAAGVLDMVRAAAPPTTIELLSTAARVRAAARALGGVAPEVVDAVTRLAELRGRALAGGQRLDGTRVAVGDVVRARAFVEWLTGDRTLGLDDPVAAGPPRISVVITTRNRAPLLRRALASLSAQQRPADQVVVVDNGSSDGTKDVVDAASDLPIDYVVLAEPSIPRGRNLGVRRSTGDIVAFLDDDEIAEPEWLRAIERAFAVDPRIGVVGGEIRGVHDQPGLIAEFYRAHMGAVS